MTVNNKFTTFEGGKPEDPKTCGWIWEEEKRRGKRTEARMETSTKTLKAKAEASNLEVMEEETRLHAEVQEEKRQYLVMEKDRQQMHKLLDLQIAALSPSAEASRQFTENCESFATAADAARHALPMKNFYSQGGRREFLVKVESRLKEMEKLLVERTQGDQQDNSTSLEGLRDTKTVSKDISQHLSGAPSELSGLPSSVCQHTVQPRKQKTVSENQNQNHVYWPCGSGM
ncbi:HAUS augmin-like complex subunit 8 [Lampris incognitus]|uniref:HAUS augmin-like complex subunit 8 n=1 Tax=Lampris incognitus TaxID=2546036 RepID=UPI0024B5E829|nr:HAUS augmin-like complex subunit 8 [Lampris incognitus]